MWKKWLLIGAVAVLLVSGVAVAAWRFSSREEKANPDGGGLEESFQSELQRMTAPENGEDITEGGSVPEEGTAGGEETDTAGAGSGEDFSYTSPGQRYVTETQRHQNFFRAVAEGRVMRLDVVSTDVRPANDPNTSYVYFTLLTSDGGTSGGTMVMKFESGMWRIAAVSQLRGDLGGGTNYQVPESFEADLAREIAELQPFLTKVAEGRLAYLEVHSVSHPSENETLLTGVVAGKGGRVVPAEMRLRRDYGLWHLTYITNPP